MSGPNFFLLLCFLLLWVSQVKPDDEEKRDVYVVYMGAVPIHSSGDSLNEQHLQLLSSVLKRNRFTCYCENQLNSCKIMFGLVLEAGSRRKLDRILYEKIGFPHKLLGQVSSFCGIPILGRYAGKSMILSYKHGFSGFAARLTKDEAATISKRAGVVSVFVDPILQLHTTRSWDFLQQTSVETDSGPNSDPVSSSGATDTIIGLLDTGIWPESESFSDSGIGAIPSRWKGICMAGPDFSASNCNKKLIGARYYNTDDAATSLTRPSNDSPRDELGHGTHTSSTAAGNPVIDASYYGLAAGKAKGGSTASRIAMYKVCSESGCPGSAILAGFDDAIGDGVDLLSVSLGASAYYRPDFADDPIAIGSFHAVAKGITVVCSAGNDGPVSGSIVNAAPWILTVAATTIDRDFESDIVLGGKSNAVKGEAINFSNLEKSPVHPLIYGGSAMSNSTSNDESASHCEPNSIDGNKIKGKIVLCKHLQGDTSRMAKIQGLKSSGAIGAILVNDLEKSVASTYIDFPVTEISSESANDILTYINSTKGPVATILPTITVTKYKPAPAVAYFSSRGPSLQTGSILKPDVAAPGVNILAAWIPENGSSVVPPGQKPSSFNLISGTSMACPHVTGIAATIKAWNPTWSPSAIRSAIITTATQMNNHNMTLTTDSGSAATPYDFGAGEVSPTSALQPGLVYELGTADYIQFLCNYGYQASAIKRIATIPDGFACPKNSSLDLISDLNYPSIAVSKFDGKASKTVNRVVTNVGAEGETAYLVSIKSPPGLEVKVIPDKLQFTKNTKKASYQVIFSAPNSALKGDLFGSITWSDGTHRVRSPFVVTST